MSKPVTDDEFRALFTKLGAAGLAKHLNRNEREVYAIRRRIEGRQGEPMYPPSSNLVTHPGRVPLEIRNGQVLVGSDFHIWPGEESVALRAFKKFVDDIKPTAIILNGDVLDFPKISRFPQDWERAPEPKDEIEAAQDHLSDIESRAKRGTRKIWTLGNHDHRFEMNFAAMTPHMRGIPGVHLSDHFPTWDKAMSCMVNYDHEQGRTMVKHRLTNGKHATYLNVRSAGTHIVTGHLHAQNVRRVSDYRPYDLYGVDSGCVTSKNHRAFLYTEDAAKDWGEGFALLTYSEWRLMMPELIARWDDRTVQFRGQRIAV